MYSPLKLLVISCIHITIINRWNVTDSSTGDVNVPAGKITWKGTLCANKTKGRGRVGGCVHLLSHLHCSDTTR